MCKNGWTDVFVRKALACKHEVVSSDPQHLHKKLDVGWEDGPMGKTLAMQA